MLRFYYLVGLIIYSISSFAMEHLHLPLEFSIKKPPISSEKKISLEYKGQILAQLTQNPLNFEHYELYCPEGHLIATVEHREIHHIHYFDVYNHQHELIGMAQESTFTTPPYFDIYEPFQRIQTIHASMNRFHTCFKLIDPISQKTLIKMSTSLNHLSKEWHVKIENFNIIQHHHIHTAVLLSILGVQANMQF